jgi:hypothetical protein
MLEPGALYSAYPWDDAGHLPVAEIAYDRFSSALRPKLQGALAGLTERNHTYGAIISAPCYMDDLCRFKHSYLALAEAPNANSVTLCSAYVAKTNQIACKQIVLAGYWLADLLQTLLSASR